LPREISIVIGVACSLAIVYALWLVRPGYPRKSEIVEELRSLGKRNLQNLEAVIAAQPAVDHAFCAFYFRECLRFSFDEREKAGFRKFAELCVRQKLLPALPPAPELL
jgi:predicted solute-binding protein